MSGGSFSATGTTISISPGLDRALHPPFQGDRSLHLSVFRLPDDLYYLYFVLLVLNF